MRSSFPGVPVYEHNPISGVTQQGTIQWLNPDAFVSTVDPSSGACVGGDSLKNCQFGNLGRNALQIVGHAHRAQPRLGDAGATPHVGRGRGRRGRRGPRRVPRRAGGRAAVGVPLAAFGGGRARRSAAAGAPPAAGHRARRCRAPPGGRGDRCGQGRPGSRAACGERRHRAAGALMVRQARDEVDIVSAALLRMRSIA